MSLKHSRVKKIVIIGVLHSTVFLGLIPYLATHYENNSWLVGPAIVLTVIVTFLIMFGKIKALRS